MMRRSNLFGCLILLPLPFILSSAPAQAGNLEEGIEAYKAGTYAKARGCFEKAIKEAPNSWQAHYYLANTYLGLGNYANAKYEYTVCQNMTTNAAVKQRCQAGLDMVAKRSGSSSSSPPAATPAAGPESGKSAASDKDGAGGEDDSKSDQAARSVSGVRKRQDEIMQKAKEQCAEIRKAAKEQIESEKANSNQRFRYVDDGGRIGLDISDERQKEIMSEADDKCKKIMEDAERSAKTYR